MGQDGKNGACEKKNGWINENVPDRGFETSYHDKKSFFTEKRKIKLKREESDTNIKISITTYYIASQRGPQIATA